MKLDLAFLAAGLLFCSMGPPAWAKAPFFQVQSPHSLMLFTEMEQFKTNSNYGGDFGTYSDLPNNSSYEN
ncbi:MAG: hypothetical protein KDD22_04145, partial [Bdellovibrionales bacterium]|nr:hypothetical protein [Bdellovibrionales bacterium]